ncbi:MAG: calcium/sodium antiporter [Desulfobacterales bacterium]|nr:calcium/sodium antiporter [Desulfobacterales bacterium]
MGSTILLLSGGILLLYIGAEGLVRGSASLAFRLGLTRLVVGLTIVAFGTSSPEMVVSVKAAFVGNGAISLGNIIGSNICNIALILGLSALLNPIRVDAQIVRIQTPIMIFVSLLLILFLYDGNLNRWEGMVLCVGIIAYVGFSIYLARKEAGGYKEANEDNPPPSEKRKIWLEGLFIVAGFGFLIAGSDLFLKGAIALAQTFGVSQAVIGLTIVALGTSLPELATSMVAAMKKEGDIAVGNVVGSNIFNILAILGIAALLRPINMDGINMIDLIIMIALAVLTLPIAKSGFIISRREGAFFLVLYGGYIYYLISSIRP